MNHREIQQTRQLEKLRSYRTVNLHYESLRMQQAHHQKMFSHVDKMELAHAALDTRLRDIRNSVEKLATKPRWRFWK